MTQPLPSAQPSASPSAVTPESRSIGFEGGQAEPLRGGEILVISAYAVLWVILVLFVTATYRRGMRLNQRIEDIEGKLDRAAAPKEK